MLRLQAKQMLDQLAVTLPLDEPIEQLTVAQQQLTEIAKALAGQASLLIMDEPTSSLSGHEVEHLLDLIRRLKAQGKLVLFISHRIHEVLNVADRVVVLRDGQMVGEVEASQISHDRIIQMMVGRNLSFSTAQSYVVSDTKPILDVRNLVVAAGKPSVSFSLASGEILCLAGLVGSGRSEILHAIFQSKPALSGHVLLDGQPLTGSHPRDTIKRGLGFVPEDRKLQGVILQMSVASNLTLTALDQLTDFHLINGRRERAVVNELIDQYTIRTPSRDSLVLNLSGGNQQKVVLAKWLSLKPRVLLVDEPARGVDVSGKAEIYELLRKMADSGVAILMVSSEIEEVLRSSTRVLVMSEGRITAELTGSNISEKNILEGVMIQEYER
jgi:ABC-type sugar transport system ATPase subunit